MLDKALLGLAIGALCGLIPLAFGFLTKHRILGIIGMTVTSAFGVIFAVLEKSPFTAMSVALAFLIFNFASNKHKNNHHHHDYHDDDIYDDGHI
jgi:hypothetical protein